MLEAEEELLVDVQVRRDVYLDVCAEFLKGDALSMGKRLEEAEAER